MDSKVNNRRKKSFKRLLKHKTFRLRNIISLVTIIVSIVLLFFIGFINILPTKYFILIGFLLLIIDIIGILFINVHKKLWLKIIGFIILFLSLIGSFLGIYYLNSTNSFLSDSFDKNNTYDKNTYYVLSHSSKNYHETDINGDIAVYKETSNLSGAFKKLGDKYSVNPLEYDDILGMFDSINNNTVSFMLIEKSSYEIVFSLSDSLKRNDYDILYEFDVYTKKKKVSSSNNDKFNVFIGGLDFAGLMDFNMIVSVNTKTHKVLLTSIPRDYYIEVVGKDGRYDKLSFMNAYGSDVNRESLEKLFNTTIDYSVIVDTNSLVKIVDYVGGIEFCSDYDFTTTHALVTDTYNDNGKRLHVSRGCQHVDGVEALTIARERNAFPGRDRVRQQNCQKIVLAIFKKMVSTDTILNYNETLNTLGSVYETNIPKKVITSIVKDILNNGNNWDIDTQSVDGVDGHDKVHLSNMIDWVMYPDNNTVDSAKDKIEEILK